MVWRSCEKASWMGLWEVIISRKWERFKELYEIVIVTDERWECLYKGLHEVGDIVWELVGGAMIDWQYWLEGGMGKADIWFVSVAENLEKCSI